jgi:isoaspartyl peptidase/L-asparaginase-like protein (Ntn-hydrolase superfamily)
MFARSALGLATALTFSSCGLIKVPFKVAGAVVEGTAHVGKKAYDASADAFGDSEEEKKEKAKKAKEEAEKKKAEDQETRKKEVEAHAAATQASEAAPPPPEDYLPDLPDPNQPLPEDPVPYQAQ